MAAVLQAEMTAEEIRVRIATVDALWKSEVTRHWQALRSMDRVRARQREYEKHFAARDENFKRREEIQSQCAHQWENAPGDPGYHCGLRAFCRVCQATQGDQ